ncbi:putative transposase YbfD/YdcC [Lipingzhangella halophila]|uniref:Putative transposase YbfD/YdcC n=1 Tax=Lipingzhangella halophila TaxID=1783352 RepID=A0A7W7RFT7_9ACTN|nr:putative transposase YbfD/YdcC [Lipingzhangella halophila]
MTFDALHTTAAAARAVLTRGGHYIAIVKGNRPVLLDEVAALPWRQVPTGDRLREHAHGRSEIRTLKAACPRGSAFPGAVQALRITRKRSNAEDQGYSSETVYALTDLHPHQADAAELAAHARGHWSAENKNHHVRDVSFREDACKVAAGSAPHALASLNNLLKGVFAHAGYANTDHARREHTNPYRAYDLLFGQHRRSTT